MVDIIGNYRNENREGQSPLSLTIHVIALIPFSAGHW